VRADRARELIPELSPLGADDVELLGAADTRGRRAFESAQPQPFTPVLLHADIKPGHLLHDSSSGALTGLLDWGDASLGHADFDLAIIGMFCGPDTLQGLLDRLDDGDDERASASIPFLLALREPQDAAYAGA
jgi:aminoglycoside phosphotransferase (APT) family kinase protein